MIRNFLFSFFFFLGIILISIMDIYLAKQYIQSLDTNTLEILGNLRSRLGRDLQLYDKNELQFCFITDFPLFEWDEDDQKWESSHHPFTMPHEKYLSNIIDNPGEIRAYCYDMVANGYELASGSIRIHKKELQEQIFSVLGYSKEQTNEQFSQLLNSFEYGAPPHGGIALSLIHI